MGYTMFSIILKILTCIFTCHDKQRYKNAYFNISCTILVYSYFIIGHAWMHLELSNYVSYFTQWILLQYFTAFHILLVQ